MCVCRKTFSTSNNTEQTTVHATDKMEGNRNSGKNVSTVYSWSRKSVRVARETAIQYVYMAMVSTEKNKCDKDGQ